VAEISEAAMRKAERKALVENDGSFHISEAFDGSW
jgi:hypothetical protein